MEIFLVLNGYELDAAIDEQERIILRVASSEIKREELTEWIRKHITEKKE